MNYGYFSQFRKYKVNLKLFNSATAVVKEKQFETPERLKGTFLERWGAYWKNLYVDYKEAALDTAKDCKAHPIRTAIYTSIMATCVYLNKHNPDEHSFKENLIQSAVKVMQVAESVRNPESAQHVEWLGQCYNEGLIRRLNLGIVSLIWLDNYDKMCALYKAICPHLKVQYLKFYERVIDVGFLDRYWVLESKMKDYDVNEAEFGNTQQE